MSGQTVLHTALLAAMEHGEYFDRVEAVSGAVNAARAGEMDDDEIGEVMSEVWDDCGESPWPYLQGEYEGDEDDE